MKRVTPWNVTYPQRNDSDKTRHLAFCPIEAEAGPTGSGKAITQFSESTRATIVRTRARGR
jgi:hypothetical protein